MTKFLLSDAAMNLAMKIVATVSPCLREEERKDAFDEIYDACKLAFIDYEEKADRMHKRVEGGVVIFNALKRTCGRMRTILAPASPATALDRRQHRRLMMRLLRLLLILSVLIGLYDAVMIVCLVPYMWVVALMLMCWRLKQKTVRLWVHGTARWADSSDLKGMIDG